MNQDESTWKLRRAVAFARVCDEQVLRARRWEVLPLVRRHALMVSIANVVVLAYLTYWGIIGLRTWA